MLGRSTRSRAATGLTPRWREVPADRPPSQAGVLLRGDERGYLVGADRGHLAMREAVDAGAQEPLHTWIVSGTQPHHASSRPSRGRVLETQRQISIGTIAANATCASLVQGDARLFDPRDPRYRDVTP
jgi:hypothetical protein